jgi:hypothetical protein
MPPIPCAHCGVNYMRHTNDPNDPKLCNNCVVREERRAPKMKEKLETIDVLIKCPKHVYTEIEEICINTGINATKYFLHLHSTNGPKVKNPVVLEREWKTKEEAQKDLPKLPVEENELASTSTTGMPDKFQKKKEKKK